MSKVALITGSARGLGRAIAEALAADGCSLFLVDILPDRLEQTKADLVAQGIRTEILATDIAERANCFAAVEAAIKAFGRLDVVVNAAGIVRFNHAHQVPEAEFARIISVNLAAPFWFAQAAIPHLITSKGNLINIASQSAQMGAPYIVPYASSKAGLIQMTKSLAMEYMDEPIRINAVSPGTMTTEIGTGVTQPGDIDVAKVMRYTGLRPSSQASEVAAVVAFVASERASSIHGAVINADAGVTAG